MIKLLVKNRPQQRTSKYTGWTFSAHETRRRQYTVTHTSTAFKQLMKNTPFRK